MDTDNGLTNADLLISFAKKITELAGLGEQDDCLDVLRSITELEATAAYQVVILAASMHNVDEILEEIEVN